MNSFIQIYNPCYVFRVPSSSVSRQDNQEVKYYLEKYFQEPLNDVDLRKIFILVLSFLNSGRLRLL